MQYLKRYPINSRSREQFLLIIPTFNRSKFLNEVLCSMPNWDLAPDYLVIVDSSDNNFFFKNYNIPCPVKTKIFFLKTTVRSAAFQRNIGIRYTLKKLDNTQIKYVAFLDDDTIPDKEYYSKLKIHIDRHATGASGILLPIKPEFSLPKKLILKFFYLYSQNEFEITKSGANIGPAIGSDENINAQWLFACSMWNFEFIKKSFFKSPFRGYTLGEDALLSYKAFLEGERLVVDKSAYLNDINPNPQRLPPFKLLYRHLVSRKLINKIGPYSSFYFYWSAIGEILLVCLSLARRKKV